MISKIFYQRSNFLGTFVRRPDRVVVEVGVVVVGVVEVDVAAVVVGVVVVDVVVVGLVIVDEAEVVGVVFARLLARLSAAATRSLNSLSFSRSLSSDGSCVAVVVAVVVVAVVVVVVVAVIAVAVIVVAVVVVVVAVVGGAVVGILRFRRCTGASTG